jgi:hypothetical protein
MARDRGTLFRQRDYQFGPNTSGRKFRAPPGGVFGIAMSVLGNLSGINSQAVIDRSNNLKPFWEAVERRFYKPETYRRRVRFDGGTTTETISKGKRKGDRVLANWGQGYASHLVVKKLARRMRLTSSRPFLPTPTQEFDDKLIEDLTEYILEGTLP